MIRIIVEVTMEDGQTVQTYVKRGVSEHDVTYLADPALNVVSREIVSGVKRGVQDASALLRGENPERPSETAMRLAALKEQHEHQGTGPGEQS